MWKPSSPSQAASPPPSAPPDKASSRTKNPGRRFGQIIRLKKDHVDTYKAYHANIWPEVAKQIRDCGIQDYGIYFDDETGLLFASFKYVGYDYAGDMARLAENGRVREWWALTDKCQESLVEGAASSEPGVGGVPAWWKPLEEVFYQA